MRFINYLSVETHLSVETQCIVSLLIFSLLLFGCSLPNTADTTANKTMTLKDYLKIESQLDNPDPEFDPVKVETVASKYGYTYQQYKDFYDNIQKDINMKDRLGESFKR